MQPRSPAIDQVSRLLALPMDYRRITRLSHNVAEELPIKSLFDFESRRDRYDIGPERVSTFSWLELPSNRLWVLKYGSTLAFVTNFKPVLMSESPDRPPEIL